MSEFVSSIKTTADIEPQIMGGNQETKWAGIVMRDLPVLMHCIPQAPCQPTAPYNWGPKVQGAKMKYFPVGPPPGWANETCLAKTSV
jgi:hypothetical protein